MRIWVSNKCKKESLLRVGCPANKVRGTSVFAKSKNQSSAFIKKFFTERERHVFENINLMLGQTLSAGVRELTSELAIPESTCKVILRKFRDAKVIKAGDEQRQGVSLFLTPFGEQLISGVEQSGVLAGPISQKRSFTEPTALVTLRSRGSNASFLSQKKTRRPKERDLIAASQRGVWAQAIENPAPAITNVCRASSTEERCSHKAKKRVQLPCSALNLKRRSGGIIQ